MLLFVLFSFGYSKQYPKNHVQKIPGYFYCLPIPNVWVWEHQTLFDLFCLHNKNTLMKQKWTDELTKNLINSIHIDNFEEFLMHENNSHKLNKLYAKIAEEISPNKNLSGEDCRVKYNKLKSEYNKRSDAMKMMGMGGIHSIPPFRAGFIHMKWHAPNQ